MATLRTWLTLLLFRTLLCFVAASLAWLQVGPAYGLSVSTRREEARQAAWHLAHMPHVKLAPGLTQTPDATLQKKIAAKQTAQAHKPVADVRPLTAAEMGRASGRGPYRNSYMAGAPMPWQRAFHDVNICTGNLFKSFTDVQVAPARGAGLVLQRTYNSNESRVGPFGVGWTHAYDIRIQEAAQVTAEEGQTATSTDADMVPRTDFFGHKHSYHRDADGLYSPPAYLYDETSSEYGKFLVNGPPQVLDDTDKGMDGTVKHYINVVTNADGTSGNERACDYIQDRHGNTTNLTYGQSYVQPDSSTRKLLTQVTDPSGRSLAFTWTNLGTSSQPAYRITQVNAPNDPNTGLPTYRVVYAYYTDPTNSASYQNLKSVTLDPDGLNRQTSFTYNKYTDGQGNVETGLLASVTDPLGETVSYQYSITPPSWDGLVNYSPTNGLWVTQLTEPAGVDASNNPRSQTWYFLPYNVSHNYSTSHPPVSFRTIISSGGTVETAGGIIIEVYIDSSLKMWRIENYRNNGDDQDLGYDGGGFEIYYDNSSNNVTEHIADGLVTEYFDASGPNDDVYTYGQHGNMLTHQVASFATGSVYPHFFPGQDTVAYYNADRYFQKQSSSDMNGHITMMDYYNNKDANLGNRGEVKLVQDAGYNDSTSPSYHKQFTYTYNQYGQKTSETNLNGVVTQYTYGTSGADLGNLITVVQDPGTGHLNRTTTMHYDIMGRVLSSTDPAGQTSTFTYNSLGQPKTVSTPAKGTAPAETITYAYDTNGRTHSVTDNRGTTVMAYELGCDRVHSVIDPVTGTMSYTYTPTGERLTMTLPGGGIWTYHYTDPYLGTYVLSKDDPSSETLHLESVTDDQGRQVAYTLSGIGRLCSVKSNQTFDQLGGLVNWCTTNFTCDTLTQPGGYGTSPWTHGWIAQTATSFSTYNDGGPGGDPSRTTKLLSQNNYTYDYVGQRKTNAVSVQLTNPDGSGKVDGSGNPVVVTTRTEAYTYDAVNRLKTVDYGDGLTQSYGFDPMGNRLQKTDSTAGTTNLTYDAANRLLATTGTGASTYTNDADGNTLTGGGRTNTWDSQNRLVSCTFNGTTSTFKYGADGLRRSNTVNGVTTYYVYDGSTLVREMQKNASNVLVPTATYLTGPRGPEYRRDDTQTELDSQNRTVSKCRWYVYDGLGSVVAEMDPNGSLTSSPKYDVYGLVRSNSGTASSKMGFVGGLGHLSEANTGLIYMRARYYDPGNGRFNSEDPSRNGDNWFVYCDNDPTNEVDKTGKSPVLAVGGALWAALQMAINVGLIDKNVGNVLQGVDGFIVGGAIFVAGVALALGAATILPALAGMAMCLIAGWIMIEAVNLIISGCEGKDPIGDVSLQEDKTH